MQKTAIIFTRNLRGRATPYLSGVVSISTTNPTKALYKDILPDTNPLTPLIYKYNIESIIQVHNCKKNFCMVQYRNRNFAVNSRQYCKIR